LCYAPRLFTIGHAAIIFPPRRFLRIPEQVIASDVMMVPGFDTTQPREIAFRQIGASAVQTLGLLVVETFHLKTAMEIIPRRASSRLAWCPSQRAT
jgi:hypothetical protein